MTSRLTTILLGLGLGFCLLYLLQSGTTAIRLPGNQQGYQPEQPIRFSHQLHAGDLQIGCLYCHSGAERSRNAGIPAASVCMNCHRFVAAPFGSVRAESDAAEKEQRAARLIVSPEIPPAPLVVTSATGHLPRVAAMNHSASNRLLPTSLKWRILCFILQSGNLLSFQFC